MTSRSADLPQHFLSWRHPLLAGCLALALGCADEAASKSTAETGSDQGTAASGPATGGGQASGDAKKPDGAPAPPFAAADAGSSPDAAGTPDTASADAKVATCNKVDPLVLYLSADDSNSMAGATVARGLVAQGQFVQKAIRPYEFLNYYSFAYPAAPAGHVAASAQVRQDAKGAYHLQIAVRAPDVTPAERRRLNLVLAVDTSSSMGWGTPGETGIELARTACLGLVGALAKGDTFSLLAWGGTAQVLVDSATLAGPDDGKLATACNSLKPGGITALSDGLATAYGLAKKNFGATLMNRVILVSDGGANVGQTDVKVIAEAAKDANGEAVYLMGIGVGDPWNYNDVLMNAVTDAGKGAYVFADTVAEAEALFSTGLLRHVEIAARDVQVQVTLPPTWQMQAFYGEQVSTKAEDVEPQHLAANDALIFHQVLTSCDPSQLTGKETIGVVATWLDPVSKQAKKDSYSATLAELLAGDTLLLAKGEAVVAYAEALTDVQVLDGTKATSRLDAALVAVQAGLAKLPGDLDLTEIAGLLQTYRKVFEQGQSKPWVTGGTGAAPIASACAACPATGESLPAMACALDLCDKSVLLDQTYSSPTGSPSAGTFAAVAQFGNKSNHLKPQIGGSYALMATGPAQGTAHSVDLGGQSMADPFLKSSAPTYNAVEWKLKLQAPPGANGLRFRHVFFSEEYDEYVGSQFNDKFYVVLEAGSTNGGKATVINYTDCRDPQKHHDFVCSPGMQFCNPRQRYCYIAVNTAASECCWLGGCPQGKAKTDIAGTGFSCASGQSGDSAGHGSSTGWLQTEWPIEPGEVFTLTFHLHDTGDGVFDSEVILDGLQFVTSVTPGTWAIPAIF